MGIRLHPSGNALPEAPTILSLASASRTDKEVDLVERHAQHLNRHVSVVPGALRREQMARVADWSAVADSLMRSQVPVFADLGQLHPASPVLPLASNADVVVVVGRPDATSVVRLRDRVAHLGRDLGAVRGAPPKLFPLLITTARHGAAHTNDLSALLAETAAKPFLVGLGFLALDDAGVRRLAAGDEPRGRLARTNLMRSARTVAAQLQSAAGATATAAATAMGVCVGRPGLRPHQAAPR